MVDGLEVKRKIFHMFAILLWLVPVIYFPRTVTLILMLAVLTINLAVVTRRGPFYSIFRIFIEHLERESNMDRPSIQAFYGNLGIFLSFLLFDKDSVYGIVVLAVGDAFSTLVGKHWGRRKLFFNREKSWEGTLAFFVTSYLSLITFTDPKTSLALSCAGAFLEAISKKVDDNLVLPLFISGLSTLGGDVYKCGGV